MNNNLEKHKYAIMWPICLYILNPLFWHDEFMVFCLTTELVKENIEDIKDMLKGYGKR